MAYFLSGPDHRSGRAVQMRDDPVISVELPMFRESLFCTKQLFHRAFFRYIYGPAECLSRVCGLGVDIYSFSQDRPQSKETMNPATMTHKEKCCLFCTGENLFLLLPEHQGAADRRLFTAINMRPVIVAIIPSSPQRPSIVSCPALLCFVSGFFFLRCIVSDNRVWQGRALMCGEAQQSIRCFEKVKRSQLELRWVVWKGRAGQGTARRTCLCNTTHTGGNSKCFVRVDLISQYSVFSVYTIRRIWISDQFSLLPLSDREGFQHEGQSKFPSEHLSCWNSGFTNFNCMKADLLPKFVFFLMSQKAYLIFYFEEEKTPLQNE